MSYHKYDKKHQGQKRESSTGATSTATVEPVVSPSIDEDDFSEFDSGMGTAVGTLPPMGVGSVITDPDILDGITAGKDFGYTPKADPFNEADPDHGKVVSVDEETVYTVREFGNRKYSPGEDISTGKTATFVEYEDGTIRVFSPVEDGSGFSTYEVEVPKGAGGHFHQCNCPKGQSGECWVETDSQGNIIDAAGKHGKAITRIKGELHGGGAVAGDLNDIKVVGTYKMPERTAKYEAIRDVLSQGVAAGKIQTIDISGKQYYKVEAEVRAVDNAFGVAGGTDPDPRAISVHIGGHEVGMFPNAQYRDASRPADQQRVTLGGHLGYVDQNGTNGTMTVKALVPVSGRANPIVLFPGGTTT